MSPLRFFGSLLVGKISSRRICGQVAGSTRLIDQTGHFAGGVRGFSFSSGLPMGEKSHGTVAAGALSVTLGGVVWYLKEDAQEPVAMTEEEAQKEDAMKKRFAEWMNEYNRTYKDKEEAARRYEIFKRNAQRSDENFASTGGDFPNGLNCFGDRTRDELPKTGYGRPCNKLFFIFPGRLFMCNDLE